MTVEQRFNRIFETLIDNRNYYEVVGTDCAPDIWVRASLEADPTRNYVNVPTIGRIAIYTINGRRDHSDQIALHKHPGLITVTHSIGVPKPENPNDTLWSCAASVPAANRPYFVNYGLMAMETALASILDTAA